jgi:hypothetical protein
MTDIRRQIRQTSESVMSGIPTWLWVTAVILAIPIVAIWLFVSRFRKMCRTVRLEIGEYLKQNLPELEVVREQQGNLVLRNREGAENVWEMADIYTAVGRLPGMGRDPQARARVYEQAVRLLLNPGPDRSQPLSLATHGDQIKLHLVSPEVVRQNAPPSGVPSTPIPGLGGLLAVYVLELPDGLCYLSEKDRNLLGIDVEELHRLALENLRRDFPRQMVDEVRAGGNPTAIQFQDCFNAARLLVIPGFLQGEEELIVLAPHRDMLLLLPAALGQDSNKLKEALETLKCDEHPPLLDRPVRVTHNGFEIISS